MSDYSASPMSTNGLGATAVVPMPLLQQHGEVFVGPGAKKDAEKIGLGLTKLSSRRKDDLHNAKKYAMDLSIKQIMIRQQKQQQENQQKQAMYAQALSLMSRIYVGSISFEIREDNLKKAFEVYGPIKALNLSWDSMTGHHKTFAFLEYEVPEAAMLALESMNGQMLGGRNLKVNSMVQDMRLPQNMPQAQPIIEMVQSEARKYHRVYVSSVHSDLSESDLKSVFEAFGTVVKCQLARNSARNGHRGFGYIEFNNASSMKEAIAAMNMFDLGGQFLRVGKCVTPPEAITYMQPAQTLQIPSAAAAAAAAITAKVMAAEATAKPETGSSRTHSPAPESVKKEESPIRQPPPPSAGSSPLAVEFVKMEVQSPVHQSPPSLAVPVLSQPPPPPAPPSLVEVKKEEPEPEVELKMELEQPKPMESVRRRGFGQAPSDVLVPPIGVIPPPAVVDPIGVVVPTTIGGGEKAEGATGAEDDKSQLTNGQKKKLKREAKKKMTFEEKMGKVLEKQKQIQDDQLAGPAFYGTLDDLMKEPEEEQEETLMIKNTADVQSMALSLIDGGGALATIKKKKAEAEAAIAANKQKRGSGKVKEAKKIQPKLNSLQALQAAALAGEMSDVLKSEAANSEDATLASQEQCEIRGNDARHLLMAKLMRTNRSQVLILRNMVSADDIDEFLEEEIKEECGKHGSVQEVIIANDPGNQLVKIFVKFNDPKQVDTARAALNGRFFNGNTVKADPYDQVLYDHGDYTG